MAKTIQQEIEELQASLIGFDHAAWQESLHKVIRESFDVVGRVVNLNEGTNLDELSTGLEAVFSGIVDKALADNPFMRRGAKMAIPVLVPTLVEAASQYTGTADDFVDEHVLPVLARWEKTIHSMIVALSGI